MGDDVTIKLEDWPATGSATRELKIGTTSITKKKVGAAMQDLSISDTEFVIEIPSDVGVGAQVVSLVDKDAANKTVESDTQSLTVTGADVTVTPASVVPGQTLTVVGREFAQNATISVIQIGAETIPAANIDNGATVNTDSSGNWSASVVIPVNATSVTANAAHQIRVLDSRGRAGVATVAIPEAALTVTPSGGRPGSFITVSGAGFPASGDITPTVNVLYDGEQRSTALTDSAGAFSVRFKVPTSVGIPSDNKVKASYSLTVGSNTYTVEAEAVHRAPAGSIALSSAEIRPGQELTITGAGFHAYATLQEIKIGTTQVTPSVTSSTGRNGGFTATALVPDLDVGLHTVSVKVNNITSVASVTVVDAATAPGTGDTTTAPAKQEAMAPADAFAALIAADNLLQAYHFDPATQDVELLQPRPGPGDSGGPGHCGAGQVLLRAGGRGAERRHAGREHGGHLRGLEPHHLVALGDRG